MLFGIVFKAGPSNVLATLTHTWGVLGKNGLSKSALKTVSQPDFFFQEYVGSKLLPKYEVPNIRRMT